MKIEKIEVKGPYLNFYLHKVIVETEILTQIYTKRKKYGSNTQGKGLKYVFEVSSPNIAKPFGIGHLRSTVIGNSLVKVHSFLG